MSSQIDGEAGKEKSSFPKRTKGTKTNYKGKEHKQRAKGKRTEGKGKKDKKKGKTRKVTSRERRTKGTSRINKALPLPSNNPGHAVWLASDDIDDGPARARASWVFKRFKSCETFNSLVRGSLMGETELIREFERYKRLYLKYKHQYSKDSNRKREQRVKSFLRFCATKGVRRIKDIKEEHYRLFVAEVLNNKATETKRKYLLALKEFFQRAHLPIRVNITKNISRTKEKKLIKLLQVLDIKLEDLDYEKVQELLKLL